MCITLSYYAVVARLIYPAYVCHSVSEVKQRAAALSAVAIVCSCPTKATKRQQEYVYVCRQIFQVWESLIDAISSQSMSRSGDRCPLGGVEMSQRIF